MSYFKKANIFKDIFFSRGTVVVLLFLIIFVGFGLYSIVGKSMDASRERKVAETELFNLNKKQTDLSKKIDVLKTPEGQADALKEQYSVVSPGEKVVVNTEDSPSNNPQVDLSGTQSPKGFWGYLQNLFK